MTGNYIYIISYSIRFSGICHWVWCTHHCAIIDFMTTPLTRISFFALYSKEVGGGGGGGEGMLCIGDNDEKE